MAKEVGKIKDSIKDIKSVERYVDFSIRGNSNQVPESDPDLYQMINDYSVYLSDKEFLEKWYDKKKFTGMHTEEEFNEFGTMEEFGVNEEYYITFKDGSEIHVVFKLPDGDFLFADDREAKKGTMAEKYIREYEMDGWDIDIDSLAKEVSGGKKMAKGGEASLKVESEKDLQEVAKYMVKAVKKRWDLKDLIHYFEQDNGFDYKVRDKAATREEIYEMPKTYNSILDLLRKIVEANGKKLSPVGSMSKGGKITAKDAGNWVDGNRGIYQGERIIEIAEEYGFLVEPTDSGNKKNTGENHWELVEDAIQYLNDHAPEGYYFGMTEGNNDFGLWESDEMGKGGLTRAKARKMLHEGVAHGKPITEQQRKYFGAVASGYARKENGGEVKKGLYAEGELVNGVIVVDADKEFDDNPLFYIWAEYPADKAMDKGYLRFAFGFYMDKAGNKYLLWSGEKPSNDEIKTLLSKKANWDMARNVDEFVEGADADSYARWLDLISHDGGEMKASKGATKSSSDGIFWLITGDIF